VIVIDEGSPPVFWSGSREILDTVCRAIRHACPKVCVIWEQSPESVDDSGEPDVHGTSSSTDPK